MRIELATLEDGKGSFAHRYAPGDLVLDDERMRLARLSLIVAVLETLDRPTVKVS